MADFSVQEIDDGVGDYHFNRFRIVFSRPQMTLNMLVAHLLSFFPGYIKSDYAWAEWGDRNDDDGHPTIRFHGIAEVAGLNAAAPHSDWVARIWSDPNIGFTVHTLKRDFFDATEDIEAEGGSLLAAVAGLAVPIVGPIVAAGGGVGSVGPAVHYNRKHFLAGRRSWRIGSGGDFGLSNDVMVLETIAVERFSAHVYNVADMVVGLEGKVPLVWYAFLNNFANQNGLKLVDQALKSRWSKSQRGMGIQLTFDSLTNLKGDQEFLDALPLYRTILP